MDEVEGASANSHCRNTPIQFPPSDNKRNRSDYSTGLDKE